MDKVQSVCQSSNNSQVNIQQHCNTLLLDITAYFVKHTYTAVCGFKEGNEQTLSQHKTQIQSIPDPIHILTTLRPQILGCASLLLIITRIGFNKPTCLLICGKREIKADERKNV
jgi:hypothetical protein